jgi:hypothetical protein
MQITNGYIAKNACNKNWAVKKPQNFLNFGVFLVL